MDTRDGALPGLLRAVLDGIKDAALLSDDDARYMEANTPARVLLGMSRGFSCPSPGRATG